MFDRWYANILRSKLSRPYVHLLFGARQTGKSTLLNALLPDDTLCINLMDPRERTRYLADPGEFAKVCLALPEDRVGQAVFVDEAQTVPSIFDAVQFLYDRDKTRWRFVLCGSSARKLRQTGANLLPGRAMVHHLHTLTLPEHPVSEGEPTPMPVESPLPLPWPDSDRPTNLFPRWNLTDRLVYGALPGVVSADAHDRADILNAYSFVYLEEEIRREALARDWGAFVRFLRLAAAESGRIVNYASISQETGISQPTVKSYYQLLQDLFVGFTVPAYSRSPRKNLLSSPKFLFFDLGVRNAAAGLDVSPELAKVDPGPLLEQWVGCELWKRLQYLGQGTLYHQRTKDGAEVDFILERHRQLTPVEVKWTENPALTDARHILAFIREHPEHAHKGYIVCRCPRPLQLNDQITALPWFCL